MREEEEGRKRYREEWEARRAEHERMTREKQESKERAQEERRAQQLIRKGSIRGINTRTTSRNRSSASGVSRSAQAPIP